MTIPSSKIDIHVGSRVRERRLAMRMSQGKLGSALGVTFQQVQKYEKGTNRISASRLQQIGAILSVPVSYFFEGLHMVALPLTGFSDEPDSATYRSDVSNSPLIDTHTADEGYLLIKAFMCIDNPAVRRQIIALVESIASQSGAFSTLNTDPSLNKPKKEHTQHF